MRTLASKQATSQRLSVHRASYWVRLVTDLSHKKRATEALRACETALAEAYPPGGKIPSPRNFAVDRQGSDVSMVNCSSEAAGTARIMTSVEEQAAAVLPLGESLPLQRRAVRLAVPPLRWRRRPPPDLKQAQLRVMMLDLSWRRAGASGGSVSSLPSRKGASSNSMALMSRRGVEVGAEEEESEDEEEGEEEAVGQDDSGETKSSEADKDGGAKGAGKIAPGTSLEQAALDTMLAELGPGWDGLHSENRRVVRRKCRVRCSCCVAHQLPIVGHGLEVLRVIR